MWTMYILCLVSCEVITSLKQLQNTALAAHIGKEYKLLVG